MRSTWAVAAAALLCVACAPDEQPSPSPSPSATEATAPPASTSAPPPATTSELPGFGEGPVPSERPERTTTLGGELEVTVGETVEAFEDVVCIDGGGFLVTASAGSLTSAQFSTDEGGRVVTAAISLPDGVTGVVGDFVGSASFQGDAQSFTVRGHMATAAEGESTLVPFSITGSCAG